MKDAILSFLLIVGLCGHSALCFYGGYLYKKVEEKDEQKDIYR